MSAEQATTGDQQRSGVGQIAASTLQQRIVSWLPLLLLLALAMGLRLLVWRWREPYGLGGDESEYFQQALTLLRERRYVELNLMRPPLYTLFLASSIYLFDSLVQRLRLIQEIISALTVLPIYGLTLALFRSRRVAFIAGLLFAANYTLAVTATELLSETLFLFGLATLFWLLVRGAEGERETRRQRDKESGRQGKRETKALTAANPRSSDLSTQTAREPSSQLRAPSLWWASLAGLALGGLLLVRSVALPLLPLGALWLVFRQTADDHNSRRRSWALRLLPALAFALATLAVVLPWTARNYLAYGTLILVDTTGAENLWLDNNPQASSPADPLGREAAKRELYALGDDRAARQRLASERGTQAILGNLGWFGAKAWDETTKFFALQFFDELRAKREIWVPPLEVGLKLLLGDGLWLALLLCGAAGWVLAPGVRRPTADQGPRTEDEGRRTIDQRPRTKDGRRKTNDQRRRTEDDRPTTNDQRSTTIVHPKGELNTQNSTLKTHLATRYQRLSNSLSDPRWLFVPWALYTLLTSALFHVELRYRLPLYPALAPYAAWLLASVWQNRGAITRRWPAKALAATVALALLAMTLLHRPYLAESWALANKHIALWRAEGALQAGSADDARASAETALRWDAESALAPVALARAALLSGDAAGAEAALAQAVDVLPQHPLAHLLRGALLRQSGDDEAARAELAYETASLQDLQGWAWDAFSPLGGPPSALSVGDGLDLGFVRGVYPAEAGGFRWSSAEAHVQLAGDGAAFVELELAPGRPAGAAAPTVTVLQGRQEIGRFTLAEGWQRYRVPVSPSDGPLVLTLRSTTFRPRDWDWASGDGRTLGVMLRRVAVAQ